VLVRLPSPLRPPKEDVDVRKRLFSPHLLPLGPTRKGGREGGCIRGQHREEAEGGDGQRVATARWCAMMVRADTPFLCACARAFVLCAG
jgi:hypothetical protein